MQSVSRKPLAPNASRAGERGFTLIEMVVGASLMAVSLTLVSLIFTESFVSQRKVIAYEQTNSNARILLDTMTREIRTSTICGNTAAVGSNGTCHHVANNTVPNDIDARLDIVRSTDGVAVSYCIAEAPAASGQYIVTRLVNADDFRHDPCDYLGNPAVQTLSSSEVTVLRDVAAVGRISGFITVGVGQTPPAAGACRNAGDPVIDTCQPRVTLLLRLQPVTQRNARERVDVAIQQTITQRLIDMP